jgi:hypothetical protein
MRYLRLKCERSLNSLNVLSGRYWGRDRTVILRIYRAPVRSKIDYGSFVYGSANKSKLTVTDCFQNAGPHLATGAFRTCRLDGLYGEPGEPPLSVRRNLLCSYVARLATQLAHPSCRAVFHLSFWYRYGILTSASRPVGARLFGLLHRLSIRSAHFITLRLPPVPPWDITHPTCDLRLTKFASSVTSALIFRQYFAELLFHYPDHTTVYTGGLFLHGSAKNAFVYNGQAFSYRLHGFNSVFTADLYALYRAVLYIRRQPGRRHLVCTDCKRFAVSRWLHSRPSYCC